MDRRKFDPLIDASEQWIRDFDKKGSDSLFDWNEATVREFKNVPVETLLKDDYFLGLDGKLYEGVEKDIIDLWADRKKREVNLALFLEAIGCVTGDQWVYTPQGPLRIKDLVNAKELGEKAWKAKAKVLTPYGIKETSHFKKTSIEKTLQIETKFGFRLRGTHNHPLMVLNGADFQYKEMKDLKEGELLGVDIMKKPFGSGDDIIDEDLGYLMGFIIGDGHIHKYGFNACGHIDDRMTLDRVGKIAKSKLGAVVHDAPIIKRPHLIRLRAKGDKLVSFLNKYDLVHLTADKVIPEIIFTSPEPVVKEFIKGYLDADGSFNKRGKISVSAKNRKLLEGLQHLLMMWGIIGRIDLKKTKWQNGRGTTWRMGITGSNIYLFKKYVGFGLPRKQKLLKDHNKPQNTNYRSYSNISNLLKEVAYNSPKAKGYNRWKLFKTYISGKQNLSHERLKMFLEHYKETGAKEAYAKLERLYKLSDNYVWLPIENIEEAGEEICYDLTLPDTGCFTVSGFWSSNSGKSFKSSIIIWLLWFELSMHINPQQHFGLADDSIIAIMLLSRSEQQTRRVVFNYIWDRFKTPFNKDYFPIDDNYTREIRINRNNTTVYPGTSSAMSALGYNVYSSIIDEANFLEVTEGSRKGQDEIYDAAQEMYNAVMNRMTSRFMKKGKLPGILVMISSPRYPDSFMERKKKEIEELGEEETKSFVRSRSLWEAKGPDYFPEFYEDDHYFVVDKETLQILEDHGPKSNT